MSRRNGSGGYVARQRSTPELTANQARYILEKLVDERTVSAADVRRHLAGMWQEMGALERRISELRGVVSEVHPIRAAKRAAKQVVAGAKKVRRTMKKASAEVMASRRLQGQYIAAIRQLPKTQRAKYAKIAKQEGREKAIAAIKNR